MSAAVTSLLALSSTPFLPCPPAFFFATSILHMLPRVACALVWVGTPGVVSWGFCSRPFPFRLCSLPPPSLMCALLRMPLTLLLPRRLTPEFRWAQRKGDVYITMNVANVRPEETTARITDDGHIYWRGYGGVQGDEREYVLDIRLFKPIKMAESSIKLSSRLVYFNIRKAESGPFWDRLLADESRNVHCKIDWDAWKDEDEEDDYYFGTWRLAMWAVDGRASLALVAVPWMGWSGPSCEGGGNGLWAGWKILLGLPARPFASLSRMSHTSCPSHNFCICLLIPRVAAPSPADPCRPQAPTGVTRTWPTWTSGTVMRIAAIAARRASIDHSYRGDGSGNSLLTASPTLHAALQAHGRGGDPCVLHTFSPLFFDLFVCQYLRLGGLCPCWRDAGVGHVSNFTGNVRGEAPCEAPGTPVRERPVEHWERF